MSGFRYTHAVVCRIPDSFKTQAIGISEEIDLDEARKQHEDYIKALREVGVDVIELPADESLPDCVFVEDTAVVCGSTALITRPGHPARRRETETMRAILKKELDLPIVEIKDEEATLEGGDVLFTGKEFFVGISSRTNEAGARAVAAAFPEYPVTPIKVSSGLHLKSSVTMAGPEILSVGASKHSQEILKRIEREATYRYNTITVPDDDAANCVFVNGTLIHRSDYPDSLKSCLVGVAVLDVEQVKKWSQDHGFVLVTTHKKLQEAMFRGIAVWVDVKSLCDVIAGDRDFVNDVISLVNIFGDAFCQAISPAWCRLRFAHDFQAVARSPFFEGW